MYFRRKTSAGRAYLQINQTHVMAERCEPAADVMGARGMRHAGR
jgi:hypothetical protein